MFGMKHKFLLSSQFPYVHDQPLAVVLMVNGLHIHHCSLDPGLILLDKQKEKPICITQEIRLQGLLHILTHTCMHALTHCIYKQNNTCQLKKHIIFAPPPFPRDKTVRRLY